ncbi:MAG: formylglycine-generating enzyme family protein [Gallionella sp.]|nr:formylglycine-generating enzyme family protein [Gallionella sp.]
MKKYHLLAALLIGLQGMIGGVQAATLKQGAASEPSAGTIWTEPKTGMEFVWAPAGCFQMGGDGEAFEKPVHKVCLKGFWIGRYEVTQKQYQQIVGSNQSLFQGENNPVERINWHDATDFGKKMSATTNTAIRLPTEAEWEYACRAGGLHDKYCGGDEPNKLGWFSNNSGMTTHPVGQLAANAWGLYDMSGNAWEWTQDCQSANYKGAPTNGASWHSGNCGMRVGRGGAWNNSADVLLASHRKFDDMGGRDSINGLRVVRASQ